MSHNLSLGKSGEAAACGYLTSEGYEIIERNYRSGHDEIDIIAEKKPYIVFVEVKTRTEEAVKRFGSPSLAVTKRKRACLIRAAKSYISQHPSKEHFYRLDVIEVTLEKGNGGQGYKLNHKKGAFGAEG